jgi:hypothetical protein
MQLPRNLRIATMLLFAATAAFGQGCEKKNAPPTPKVNPPAAAPAPGNTTANQAASQALRARVKGTVIPTITLRDAPLKAVLKVLSELSATFAPDQETVNFVLSNPSATDTPQVSISIKNLPLDRLLDYITANIGYEWAVADSGVAIKLQPKTPPNSAAAAPVAAEPDPAALARLKATIIPTVTFRDAPLNQVLATPAELSSVFDPQQKHFNILVVGQEAAGKNPPVSFQGQGLSLDQALGYIVKGVGYNYTINKGVIEVRLNGEK